MLQRIIKYLGLFTIVSFSAISIIFSTAQRDFLNTNQTDLMSYTSFFEDRFYDLRMKQTLDPEAFDDRLVLVAIDDYSLKKIAKWPIPRDNWAKMMTKLEVFGAKVIAYDVFFSEDSLSCGKIPPEVNMANAIKSFQKIPGNKVIIPYKLTHYNNAEESFEELPEILYNFMMDTRQVENINLITNFVDKGVFPLKVLTDTDAQISHIEAHADPDGIFRHYPIVGNVDTLYFPSYALSTYEHLTGDKPVLELLNEDDKTLALKNGKLNLNMNGEVKIRWFGGMGQFPFVSLYDVISAPDDDPKMKKIFNGNIAFVGSTAFGAHDLRHTPIDSMLPGIYFHMNMVHMLLEGKFFKPEEKSTIFSWGILIAGTLLILIVQFFGNALFDLFSVVLIGAGLYLYDTYVLLPQGYEIKLFFCLFSVVACYSWNTFLHFYSASKDKAFLKNAFGNYISPELIDEMYKTGEAPKLGGDCGVRTAYFTDIQGFSTFSEQLSATKLVELLNEYLTAMTDILLHENGTLDKYEGDAIIAFFGAPMPLEDHAARACLVAHRMQEALLKLRKKWISEGDKWPEIVHGMRMRIGINSGEIVTGNMGSASRMNYTMMGDSVNLAARLEESAKQYGIFTQASKESVELAGEGFIWRELDTIKVMGKTIPVTTFELFGMKDTTDKYLVELSENFKKGIELYKSQSWDAAIDLFTRTLDMEHKRFPELKGVKTNPSEIYLKRCEDYKASPPSQDWDGVYILTSK